MRIRYTLAACLGLLLTGPPLTASTLRTVALSTDVMPGSTAGQRFTYFAPPVINDLGKTAFFSGDPSSWLEFPFGYHVWFEGSSTLEKVAETGGQVPGLPTGVVFNWFNQIGFNNAGDIALRANLRGTGINEDNDFATFIKTGTHFQLIAREGDPVPGVSGATFGTLESLVMNESAEIAYRDNLYTNGSLSLNSIWKAEIGELNLVARTGALIPGSTLEARSILGGPVINDSGELAVAINGGIWVGQPGNLQVVSVGSNPVINGAGHVAFHAGNGILSNRSGSLIQLVRNGDPAPGTPIDVFFLMSGVPTAPVLNNSNHIAFRSSLIGTSGGVNASNNTGIWSDVSGALQLVAREGDPAPGVSDGSVFGEFEVNSYVLNANGQIAFLGRLTGPNISVENDFGIWATDKHGELQLIAREGDLLEASPGSFRTVSELVFFTGTGNADGRRSGFNDLGQLAFVARFTDRTEGIFVSSLVQIPEPSTYVLLLVALILAAAFRGRTRQSIFSGTATAIK